MDEAAGKLKIYSSIPKGYNASFDYRIISPLRTMEELKLPIYPIVDFNEAHIEPENRLIAFSYSDFNLFYQPVSSSLVDNLAALRKAGGGRRSDGTWKWIPTTIVDTDDDLFNVHPANPAFRELGVNRPDGSPLMPGDEIGMLSDDTGENVVMWKDGEAGFDIAKNQQRLTVYRQCLRSAHAITCTTSITEQYVKREAPAAWTYVFPNSIRFDEYPNVELAEHPSECRIMWQGSTTHYEDLWPLATAMKNISEKYPHVKWVFWGAKYNWPTRFLPADRVKFLPWVNYQEYKPRLATINHDINICPLTDHQFNRCRSAIKFYESSAICKPAATLAQATGPYPAEIIEDKTGLLWDTPNEFEQQLGKLIENTSLRKQLAANAADWVRQHRDAFKTVPKLWEFYMTVRDKQMKDNPEPIVVLSKESIAGQYDALDLEFDPAEAERGVI